MKSADTCVSVYPTFNVKAGKLEALKDLVNIIISRAQDEPETRIFSMAFSDNQLFLRESYSSIEGFKAHLESVKDIIEDFFAMLDLVHLAVIAPASAAEEMQQLMDNLGMEASLFIVDAGFAS